MDLCWRRSSSNSSLEHRLWWLDSQVSSPHTDDHHPIGSVSMVTLTKGIDNLRLNMIKRYLRDSINRRLSARSVFSKVYDKKKWGDKGSPFYSGPGSDDDFAIPYIELIDDFIEKHFPTGADFVDLGCGDFRVGRKLVKKSKNIRYLGVDVVPKLIEYNQKHFGADNVKFSCLDLAEEPIPSGNVAAIRQVFQHLSNQQIIQTYQKFDQYDAVFITEHYPKQIDRPNVDIAHGRHSRRKLNSAVLLDHSPFSLKNLSKVLTVPHRNSGEELITYLYLPKKGESAQ